MNKFNYDSRIGILGYGEIGSSLEAVYLDFTNLIFIKDLKRDDGLESIDILNICIPYSENFEDIVVEYVNQIKPKLTIIHSTLIPGTTKNIINKTGEKMIVHSPVRGVHPKLYDGIKSFVKFIGADSNESARMAESHFKSMSIKTEICENSTTTEMGKMLSTTYYGLCIAWHGEVQKLCEKFNVPFREVMTRFNETYNDGYSNLGKSNVIRPVLFPPNSKIGGHCVVPNAILLNEIFSSLAIDLILQYKDTGEDIK